MKRTRDKGIVDLPIIIVICIFISILTVGIGEKALIKFDSVKKEQNSIKCFNRFIEKSYQICFGELKKEIKINLDLNKRKITFENKLVKLKDGKETIRAEYLPLPVKNISNKPLVRGKFILKLTEKRSYHETSLFIKIERVKK